MRLKKEGLSLKALAAGFAVNDFLPDAVGLREGLSAEQFARDYGNIDDPRCKAEVAGIRKRIEKLPGYNER